MFLHLIIAAALLSPGTNLTAAAAPAAAMVCAIAAEIQASVPSECHGADTAQRRPARPLIAAPAIQVDRLTTQLRR